MRAHQGGSGLVVVGLELNARARLLGDPAPLELMGRLAALTPPPRAHLVRYFGVLAPNARLREQVVQTLGEHCMGGLETEKGVCSSRPLKWTVEEIAPGKDYSIVLSRTTLGLA